MSLKITKAYKINQCTIFRTKPVIIKGMSPAVNEGFPFAQTLFSMRKMIPQKIDLPRTMRKKAQREVLLFSLLRLALNRLQKPSLLRPEWILSWEGGPPLVTSVRAQMTGQIVCADTAVKEPFVVAGSATRGRGDASEKRCPAAKADGTDERQRRVADLQVLRFSFSKHK